MVDSPRYKDWLDKSIRDIKSAKIFKENDCGNDIVAFHCQQAIEKVLKGYILCEYMASNVPANTCAKVYLSLGIAEEHSRNQRMAGVGDCTRKAADILEGQLTSNENLKLEWNNGGHFTEIPDRFRKAILWLMGCD